jgi:hypothetical protein
MKFFKYNIKAIVFLIVVMILSSITKGQDIVDSLNVNYVDQKTYIDELLDMFKRDYINTHMKGEIVSNNISVLQQLELINKDFNTNVFSRFNVFKCLNFFIDKDKDTEIHLGIIEIGFKNSEDLETAYSKVKSSKRHNFLLATLTVFKLQKRGDNLIFVYSETPYQKGIMDYFKKIK